MLSIYGVQDARLRQYPFYNARYEQELVTLAAPNDYGVEGVVVRSVQWFEFALNPAGAKETTAVDGTRQVEVQEDWFLKIQSPQPHAIVMKLRLKSFAGLKQP